MQVKRAKDYSLIYENPVEKIIPRQQHESVLMDFEEDVSINLCDDIFFNLVHKTNKIGGKDK